MDVSWTIKKAERWRCFWIVVLEKTLESPLDCKEIQPVHPKGDQSWVFIGRTDVEAETLILWPPGAKNWLTGEDPDAGKDWGQEKKGMTEDEMVGWHHQLNGHEFEWTLGVGDGQGGLACCSPWGCKESDTTEQLNWTDSCFIMLCWFLHNRVNQLYVYIHPLPRGPPSRSPLIPPLWVLSARAEFPVPSSRFSLALCLTHGSAYMSIPISQPVLPNFTPAPSVHTSFLSESDSCVYRFEVWGRQLLAHVGLLRAPARVCSRPCVLTRGLTVGAFRLLGPPALCRWPGLAPWATHYKSRTPVASLLSSKLCPIPSGFWIKP